MTSIIDGTLANDNSRTLAPAAVGSQVALMGTVSIVTILLFNILRPKNKIIYEPKVKYHEGDKPPPRISDSLFGWLPPLVTTKEPELLDKIGLDAVAFLRFLRLLRWLFAGITLLACGILIPINVIYNLRFVKPKKRDILSMLTIRDVGGNYLYAHIVVTYLITFLIICCVNVHWRAMIRLRRTWFRSPEYLQSFYARTLLVRRVPKKFQSDEGLTNIFQSTKVPYPTTSVHIGRKVGKLPELIDYHNQTVREFEEVLVKYLKGGKIKSKRPMIRVGGNCGLGGTKRDAIDFYTAKLQRTEAAIEEYRTQIDTRKAENYGFASMAAVPYAHVVAKQLSSKHPKGTEIVLAPNPKDIIWGNMNTSDAELARKRLLGFVWLFGICFFNTVPLFIISVLANLDSIRSFVPFLQTWFDDSPASFAIASGVLPPAISGLFGFFLPVIMRWLTKYMGALTHSKLDRAVVARYFTFLIISQLVIFTLLGVIFNSVQQIIDQIGKASFKEILENLHELPATIHSTYINQASYWLTFFPLRGFLAVFDLAQIINLVWLSFKTHVFGRTPRHIREWTQPPEFQYAVYYSNLLFMASVGLVFAPLAPLVVLAAAIVFWMSSWVYKYQLMFVYVSKVESGGRIWNVIINRLLFCVVLMQALMILTIGLRYKFKSFIWVSVVPPILFIFLYKLYINATYLPAFHYFSPTEEEISLAKVYSERADAKSNRLEKRFGHPALHAELFTPMLHKNLMPLLSQVYQGKIGKDHAKLDEYGGQQMEAQVVAGGIKIAAIDQRDLEYDPALYQRDRGELDWDARSMASNAMFESSSKAAHPGNMHFHHHANSSSKNMYDKYLAGSAHGHGSEMELKAFDSMEEPLLSPRSMVTQMQGFASQQSLVSPGAYSPSPSYVSTDNLQQGQSPVVAADQSHSSYSAAGQGGQQHQRQTSSNMLAQGQQMRTQSPSPYGYPPQQQQPQHHGRQESGNMLAVNVAPNTSSQSMKSPPPGPYQAYAQQPQDTRPRNGNMLSPNSHSSPQSARTPSPGPYLAYAQQSQGREPSPGPYQAYAQRPQQTRQYPPQQQQQHAGQMSGNLPPQADYHQRAPSTSPQPYSQAPPGLQSPAPSPYQQQQQSRQQPGDNSINMAGRGAHRG